MERANVAELRKSLVAADALVKAGIRFIPIPVLNDEDYNKLAEIMKKRLEMIEKLCSEG